MKDVRADDFLAALLSAPVYGFNNATNLVKHRRRQIDIEASACGKIRDVLLRVPKTYVRDIEVGLVLASSQNPSDTSAENRTQATICVQHQAIARGPRARS